MSQEERIVELLIETLQNFDPSLDLTPGSDAYVNIVTPISDILSTDPFDLDIEEFLMTRLRQEYPSLRVQSGDAIVDLLIRPLQLLLEVFKRELEIIKIGQSVNNIDLMRTEDAEDLASNFFITRKGGIAAFGSVRIFFNAPRYVSINSSISFSTSNGVTFFPTITQEFRPETLLLQRSGDQYYVDITVEASEVGSKGNIDAGSIVSVSGLNSVARVTNLYPFLGGEEEETKEALLTRVRSSLTERSLNTKKGIKSRILSEFPTVKNIEVIGYGDPEMKRDVLKATSVGPTLCSGMSFIVGRYVFLITGFQDKGPQEDRFVKAGDKITLNFWKFLYTETKNETISIERVIYSSNEDIPNLPTVYILKLEKGPSVLVPNNSLMPGVLPGVFSIVTGASNLAISVHTSGTSDFETLLPDDEVHVGGKYDLWIRPSSTASSSATISLDRSNSYIQEEKDLTLCGDLPSFIQQYLPKNTVHRNCTLSLSSSPIPAEKEIIKIYPTSSPSYILGYAIVQEHIDSSTVLVSCLTFDLHTENINWNSNLTIQGQTTGITCIVNDVKLKKFTGVKPGMLLSILNSEDKAQYKILDMDDTRLFLDKNLTVTSEDIFYRIIEKSEVNVSSPRAVIIPFSGSSASDLQTYVGSPLVKTTQNIISLGAVEGDLLEIIIGEDIGEYRITELISPTSFKVASPMTATNSNVQFRIIRDGGGLELPFLRIVPGSMQLISSDGSNTGFVVPYAKSIGTRFTGSVSGSKRSFSGRNGFILGDGGSSFQPSSDIFIDESLLTPTDIQTMSDYGQKIEDCISIGCNKIENTYTAVVTVTTDSAQTETIATYLKGGISGQGATILQDLRAHLVSIATSFGFPTDVLNFINLFSPLNLSTPPTTENIIKQYEISIPHEVFDTANNVFVGIPEFDWEKEFSGVGNFTLAVEALLAGTLRGSPSPLVNASPGDFLTIESGPNKGSYEIARVFKYKWYHGDTIQTDVNTGAKSIDDKKAYDIVFVTIKGEFPNKAFNGLSEYLATGVLPDILNNSNDPDGLLLDVTSYQNSTGNTISSWEVVQESFNWLFEWLKGLGFDLPGTPININTEPALINLTKNLFTPFTTGKTSCAQPSKMYFIEPTSVTIDEPSLPREYQWKPQIDTPPVIFSHYITLPLPDLNSYSFKIKYKYGPAVESVELNIDLSNLSSEINNIETLATELQTLIDPTATTIYVEASSQISTSKRSGKLSLTLVRGGSGSTFKVEALAKDTGARLLGFAENYLGPQIIFPQADVLTNVAAAISNNYVSFDNRVVINTLEVHPDDEDASLNNVFASIQANINNIYIFGHVSLDSNGASNGDVADPFLFNIGDVIAPVGNSSNRASIIYRSKKQHLTDNLYYHIYAILADSGVVANLTASTDVKLLTSASGPFSGFSLDMTSISIGLFHAPANRSIRYSTSLGTDLETLASVLTQINTSAELFVGSFNSFASNISLSNTPSAWDFGTTLLNNFDDASGIGPSLIFSYVWNADKKANIKVSFDPVGVSGTLQSFAPINMEVTLVADHATTSQYAPNKSLWYQLLVKDTSSYGNPLSLDTAVGGTSTEYYYIGTRNVGFVAYQPFIRHQQNGGMYTIVNGKVEDAALQDFVEDFDTILTEWTGIEEDLEDIATHFNSYPHFYQQQGSDALSTHMAIISPDTQPLNGDRAVQWAYNPELDQLELIIYGINASSPGGLLYTTSEYGNHITNTTTHPDINPLNILSATVASPLPKVITTITSFSSLSAGSSSPAPRKDLLYIPPSIGTQYSRPYGDTRLIYTVEAKDEVTYYIEPRRRDSNLIELLDLPRDLSFAASYPNMESIKTFFSKVADSPLKNGVKKGDIVFLHPQVEHIERVSSVGIDFLNKFDCTVGVRTITGSYVISLPSNTSITFDRPEDDAQLYVEPGDILYIEEGQDLGGYTIVDVSSTTLTLDTVMAETTPTIYLSGSDGIIQSGAPGIELPTTPLNPAEYTGRMITISGSQNADMDGSYKILSVTSTLSSSTLYLETEDFTTSDTDLHWAITNNSSESLGDSSVEGRTKLFAVRPIRIYKKTPIELPILFCSPNLKREESYLEVLVKNNENNISGYKHPYSIRRPGKQNISSTAMSTQGKDESYYYLDINLKSLGGGQEYNLPANSIVYSDVRTYLSEGYHFKSADEIITFTDREDTNIIFTPDFLPYTKEDKEVNREKLEGASVNFTYDISSSVSTIQSFVRDSENRVVCADPLVHHFLPGYVSMDIQASGGNTSQALEELKSNIENLEPEATLQLSNIEGILHRYRVSLYTHPILISTVTHDLDRNLILTMSENAIEDSIMFYNGTNRLSYFIVTSTATVEPEGPGERILISNQRA